MYFKFSKIISLVLVIALIITVLPLQAIAQSTAQDSEANKEIVREENINAEGDSQKEVSIIGEVKEKREKNVKHFLKEDGTFEAAVYPTAVHYEESGQWVDIDNTLIDKKDERGNSFFENKDNDFKVRIAKNAYTKKLVSVKKDKYEITWNLEGTEKIKSSTAVVAEKDTSYLEQMTENEKQKTLTSLTSTVNFKEVMTNVDFQYIVEAEQLKENIILNSKIENPVFTFNLDTKNLIAEHKQDNTIIFYDAEDKATEIFIIDSPFMFDAKGEQSNKIEVEFKTVNNGYVLVLRPDIEWLNNSARCYPVTIDPYVSTGNDSASVDDNMITPNNPDAVYYNLQPHSVGGNWDVYMKFVLPTLSEGDYITKADLNMTVTTSIGLRVDVHKSLGNWNERTLTWNNQPGFDSRVYDYEVIPQWDSYYKGNLDVEFDVTGIVNEWYNTGNNYGLVMKPNYSSTNYVNFYSSESSMGYGPRVTIYYTNMSGLENYWSYHEQNLGRAGNGYVNKASGNLVYVHEDLSTSGNRLPFNISHVYNSTDSNTNFGFGSGWRLNLNQRVYSDLGGFIYEDADGTRHFFQSVGSGEYIDTSGLGLKIISGYTPKMVDKMGNERYFSNSGGYLTTYRDSNSNDNSILSNGYKVSSIKDGAGRYAYLYYTNNLLTSIKDPSNRTVATFSYTGELLTSITYADGKSTTYTYDSNNKLASITNHDGYKVEYNYSDGIQKKVIKIEEKNTGGTLGNVINGSYGENTSSFTDITGKKIKYQFNNYGNVTNIIDWEGNAKYYQYATGLNKYNKTSLASKVQRTILNYLVNHNAEIDSTWASNAWGDSIGSSSYTTESSYIGGRSLKVDKTNTTGRQYYQQEVTLIKGNTYSFSGYIKTNNISSTSNKGALLFVQYKDNTGNWVSIESEKITGTNDWQREGITFTLPVDAASDTVYISAGLTDESGTAYFDCLQLEDGKVLNRYNIIENQDFSKGSSVPTTWSKNSACDDNDLLTLSNDLDYPLYLDKNCFMINGTNGKDKRLSQTINISGSAKDTYTLGAWAKASSIPCGTSAKFQLEVSFNGSSQKETIDFNHRMQEWQYISGSVMARYPYTSITVSIVYSNNANTSYFDGIQLYKEEFGTSYQYDENGNLISTQDLAAQNSQFQYSTYNTLIKSIDPKGNDIDYDYDGRRNLIKATTKENIEYGFTYDNYGNPLTAKVGNTTFIQTTATYTTNGNYIKTLTDPSGNTINYNYDETKGTLTSFVDAKGKTASYTYDNNFDYLTNVSKTVDGQTVSNSYNYINDRLNTITHNNFSYTFDYDSLGNNTAVKVGTQALVTNEYEARTSKLLSQTYGNGQNISSDYDSLDRIASQKYNSNIRYKYSYDASGNVGVVEDLINNLDIRYTYDLSERLIKIKDNTGKTTSFGYDKNNNISKITELIDEAEYQTAYEYDGDNRPSKVTADNNSYKTYTYDNVNRLSNISINTGSYTYNTNFSYLSGINGSTTNRLGTITNNGSGISYTYDFNGNIETITQGGKVIRYYYNELNEVIREDNEVISKTITYSYDAGGNITSKTEYAYTTAAIPVNPTKVYNYTYDTAWKDKLISYDGNAIIYDQIGNPLSDGTYTYTWEMGRQLAAISGNGNNISFKYNDAGIRTEKTVNGVATKYHLVGDKVTYETNGIDEIYYTYDANNDLVSMNLNGTEYYYIRNGQGDIIGLFDSNGAEVVKYTYDTWGKLVSVEGTLADTVGVKNPYRYRGYRYDSETGMYYLQSRYYNPVWGRFVNADDLGVMKSMFENSISNISESDDTVLLMGNIFAYCWNNPVNYSDPSGYLSLGENWWNNVENVAWLLDVIIATIPVLFAISNAMKAAKTAQAISKAAGKMGKDKLRQAFIDLSIKAAKATGWLALADLGSKIYDLVITAVGTSLGEIIAQAIDSLDGKNDEYIFAH